MEQAPLPPHEHLVTPEMISDPSDTVPENEDEKAWDESSTLPLLCQINDMAVSCMERGEYDSAEEALQIALQVINRDEFSLPLNTVMEEASCAGATDGDASAKTSRAEQLLPRESTCTHECKHCRPAYDEGMDPFPEPLGLSLAEGSLATGRTAIATVLYNMARLFHSQKLTKPAFKFYEIAAGHMDQESWTPQESKLWLAIVCGKSAINYQTSHGRSTVRKLRRMYKRAVEHCRKAFGVQSIEFALCCNALGLLHYHLDVFDTASELLLDCQSILQKIEAPGSQGCLGVCLYNLGRTYVHLGKFDEALIVLERSLDIHQNRVHTGQRNAEDAAATLFTLGQVHHKLGNYERAVKAFENFRSTISPFGTFDSDVSIASLLIASIYHNTRGKADALLAYAETYQFDKPICDSHGSDIAAAYRKIGDLLRDIGNLDDSLQAFKNALEVDRRFAADCLLSMGEVFKLMDQHDRAMACFQQALKWQKKFPGTRSSITAKIMIEISSHHIRYGQFSEALANSQAFILSRRESHGDMDEWVAAYLAVAGACLLGLGNHALALERLLEAYRIRLTLSRGHTNCETLKLLGDISAVLLVQGNYKRALEHLRDLEIQQGELLGPSDISLVETRFLVAHALVDLGDLDGDIDYFEQCLADLTSFQGEQRGGSNYKASSAGHLVELLCGFDHGENGENNLNGAHVLTHLGHTERARGNVRREKYYYGQARQIYDEHGQEMDRRQPGWFIYVYDERNQQARDRWHFAGIGWWRLEVSCPPMAAAA